jgi:hypothetical protein
VRIVRAIIDRRQRPVIKNQSEVDEIHTDCIGWTRMNSRRIAMQRLNDRSWGSANCRLCSAAFPLSLLLSLLRSFLYGIPRRDLKFVCRDSNVFLEFDRSEIRGHLLVFDVRKERDTLVAGKNVLALL